MLKGQRKAAAIAAAGTAATMDTDGEPTEDHLQRSVVHRAV